MHKKNWAAVEKTRGVCAGSGLVKDAGSAFVHRLNVVFTYPLVGTYATLEADERLRLEPMFRVGNGLVYGIRDAKILVATRATNCSFFLLGSGWLHNLTCQKRICPRTFT